MTSADLIPAAVLKRKAVVYVRQSTQSQVMTNLESQRRQYDLVEVARRRGFVDVENLGRSAPTSAVKPQHQRPAMVNVVLECFDGTWCCVVPVKSPE